MYKYIIFSIIVALFGGCSAPKPKHAPSWYTTPPKDFNFFYAVSSGKTLANAKNKAIVNLRQNIISELDSAFKNKTTKIKIDKELNIQSILNENEHLINTMSLVELTIDKTAKFAGEELVLIKLPRKSVFDRFNIISTKRLAHLKESYGLLDDKDSYIKQYSILYTTMKDFPRMASIIEAKKVVIGRYDLKEVAYLNTLRKEFLNLKNQISIYVLSDINSRIYVKSIKNALSSTGLELSSKPKSDKSLKLLITSKTDNIQDYSFNRSKSLVKYTTYDLNRKQVAFRQHTFSAKSRRSYVDAKLQTAQHQKAKVRTLGIFDFLGIK